MITRAKNPLLHFDDLLGVPLAGGKLYTYAAGTTTPVTTYRDSSGTLNTNPVVLNARGECEVWLDPSVSYRFVVKNRLGVTVYTADDVTADTMTYEAEGSDTISVETTTEDGKTTSTFSVTDNSIGRDQLKNPRPFIPDSAYLQFITFDSNIVVTLSEKLKEWLEQQGFVADE